MSDETQSDLPKGKPIDLGVYNRPERGLDAADVIAIGLTIVWLIGTGIYFLALKPDVGSGDSGGFLVTLLAVFLPVGLIWIGSTVTKTSRMMREESVRLQASIDAMRQAYLSESQAKGVTPKPEVEQRLDALAAAQRETRDAIAVFATSRDGGPVREPESVSAPAPSEPLVNKPNVIQPADQPALALEPSAEDIAPPISISDFIGALNFPQDENDIQGFRQLRLALASQDTGRLIRSAQDVLTLVSQDGIYMDDLPPVAAPPSMWRDFANGVRGSAISAVGGVHDHASISRTAARMRSDAVFRDTVHHFLREFDKTFADFAEIASDDDIARLATTRTARAFMLLGRVTGTFD